MDFQRWVVIQLLLDIEAFYDSILLDDLIADAATWDIPKQAAGLALQQHLAPKVLQIGKSCSQAISSHASSILAGCASSTRLAKALTRGPTTQVHTQQMQDEPSHTGFHTGVHVDDVTQLVGHHFPRQARQIALEAGQQFVDVMRSKGFTISSKSSAISSRPKEATAIAKAFGRIGILIQPAPHTEDLWGHSYCGQLPGHQIHTV